MKEVVAAFLFLCQSVAVAGGHVLSFENEPKCVNGRCVITPGLRAGSATCVPVAYTRDGSTVVLTADHNIDSNQDQFVVGAKGNKYRATIVARDRSCDVAAAVVRVRFSINTIERPAAGSNITLVGVLSRRLQRAGGRVARVDAHQVTFVDVWSHPGMSGGGVFNENGHLVSIFHSSAVNGPESYGCSDQCISAALNAASRRLGPLTWGRDVNPPPPAKSSAKPERPASSAESDSDRLARLQREIDALKTKEEAERKAADAKRAADAARVQSDRLKAEIEELKERLARPAAPEWKIEGTIEGTMKQTSGGENIVAEPAAKELQTRPPAESEPASSPLDRLGDGAGGTFLKAIAKLGISALKMSPEIAVPLAAATPYGAAGLAALGVARWLYNRRRKKKRPALTDNDEDEAGDGEARPPPASADEFSLTDLPFQNVDYCKTWADHWAAEGKSIELVAEEFSGYVNAFRAVRDGALSLPGVADGEAFYRDVMNWIHRQFVHHNRSKVDTDNQNHRAFFAFLHREAAHNIRNGRFNEVAPNPAAADVLEAFVNEKLVGRVISKMESVTL